MRQISFFLLSISRDLSQFGYIYIILFDIYFFSPLTKNWKNFFSSVQIVLSTVHSMLDKQSLSFICTVEQRTLVFKSLASTINYFSVNLCHFHNLLVVFNNDFMEQLFWIIRKKVGTSQTINNIVVTTKCCHKINKNRFKLMNFY